MLDISLLSTTYSLLNYFSLRFPDIAWYPYWYLGNPYFWLIGPIIPLFTWLMRTLGISILDSYLLIVFSSIPITALGLYFLSRSYKLDKKSAFSTSLFYIVFPAVYLVMPYQNGLKFPALSLIPLLLLTYKKYLKEGSYHFWIFNILIVTIILLINSAALLMVFFSLISLIIASNATDRGLRAFEMLLTLISGIIISSFWYTPEYWWILMINPSTGGMPLFKLIIWSIRTMLQILPILAAIYLLRINKKKLNENQLLAYLLVISFIMLTLIRFFMDPDFIMDWTGFVPEMQMGIALLAGIYISRVYLFKKYFLLFLFFSFVFSVYYVGSLFSTLITSSSRNNSYKNYLTAVFDKYIAENERIFLSGYPVFWLNEKTNYYQIRGGNDPLSKHTMWAHGAYQIREGTDAVLTANWLRILGASYILVHTDESAEHFKDFKNTAKYNDINQFKKLYSKNGDILYKINNSSIARTAERNIYYTQPLRNGADRNRITEYVKKLKNKLNFKFSNANEITVHGYVSKNEVVSLAVTYDQRWKLKEGSGKLIKDAMSNTLIIPDNPGQQKFILHYQKAYLDWLLPLFCSLLIFLAFMFRIKIYLNINKVFQRFSFGINESDEDY